MMHNERHLKQLAKNMVLPVSVSAKLRMRLSGLIRKSQAFKDEKAVFEELKKLIHTLGAIVSEQDLLTHLSKDKLTQNHIHLYLTLGDDFKKHKEDDDSRHVGVLMMMYRKKFINH